MDEWIILMHDIIKRNIIKSMSWKYMIVASGPCILAYKQNKNLPVVKQYFTIIAAI